MKDAEELEPGLEKNGEMRHFQSGQFQNYFEQLVEGIKLGGVSKDVAIGFLFSEVV